MNQRARILTSDDEAFWCPRCSTELRFKESREYEKYGIKEEFWVCTNCLETWCIWEGPELQSEPETDWLHRLLIKLRKGKG